MGRNGGKNKIGLNYGDTTLGADVQRIIEDLAIGEAKMIIGASGKPTIVRRLQDGSVVMTYPCWLGGYKSCKV